MKIGLFYFSKHHGNTLKIVEEIKKRHPDIETVNSNDINPYSINVDDYDLVILASGIYWGGAGKPLRKLAKKFPAGQKMLILTSHGSDTEYYPLKWRAELTLKGYEVLDSYGSKGFYDMWPYKKGRNHGHPNADEVSSIADSTDLVIARLEASHSKLSD